MENGIAPRGSHAIKEGKRTMIEQRVYARKLLEIDAAMADEYGNFIRWVKLLNISRMGIAFAIDDALAAGELYVFHFGLPGKEEQISFTASIVHTSTNTDVAKFRIGARFAKIADQDAALIDQYVNS